MTVTVSREKLVTGWKKWEKAFLSVETLLILVLGLVLYADFQRRLSAGEREQIGIITFKQKTVQRKYSGRAVWENMESSFPLYNRDSIRTGDLSDAEITLNDGTQLEVDENTLIVLNISKEEKEIDFAYGSLTANRAGEATEGSEGLSIRSGDRKIGLNNANVNLTQTDSKSLLVDVKEGFASLISGGEEKSISSEEKAVVTGDDIEVKKKPLRVISPSPNYRSVSSGEWNNITYQLEGWEPGISAVLEFSRSRNFKNIFYKRPIPSGKFTEPFKPGVYYWRVMVDGNTSSIGKVSLVQVKPSRPVSPSNGQKFFIEQSETFIPFSWTLEEGVSQYHLQISEDREFKRMVLEKNTMGSSISTNLKEGNYHWRIKSVIAGESDPIYSSTYRFAVTREEQKNSPSPLHPKNGDVFARAIVAKSGISFFWSRVKGYTGYELQLSKDSNFSQPTLVSTESKNNLVYKNPLEPGAYYWRVRGVTGSGSKGNFSEALRFELSDVDKNIFNLQSESSVSQVVAGQDGVLLKWKKLPAKGVYEVVLAKDKDFKVVVKKILTNLNQATIKELTSGKYYWKVSLLDENGNPSLVSDYKSFAVSDQLGPVYPTMGAVVNMTTKKNLKFEWERRPGIRDYIIHIYSEREGDKKLILQKSTAGNAFILDEIELLDQGQFSWEIYYQEAGEKKKEFSSGFSIALDPLPDELELLTPNIQYAD